MYQKSRKSKRERVNHGLMESNVKKTARKRNFSNSPENKKKDSSRLLSF